MAQAHHAGVPLATKAQRREHAEKQRQQKEDAAIVGPVVQIPLIPLGKRRAFPLLGIQQRAVYHAAVIIRQRLACSKAHKKLRAGHSQHHNRQKLPAAAHKRVQKAAALGGRPGGQQGAQPDSQQPPLHQRGK